MARACLPEAYLKKEKGLCGHDIGCDIRRRAATTDGRIRSVFGFDVGTTGLHCSFSRVSAKVQMKRCARHGTGSLLRFGPNLSTKRSAATM